MVDGWMIGGQVRSMAWRLRGQVRGIRAGIVTRAIAAYARMCANGELKRDNGAFTA